MMSSIFIDFVYLFSRYLMAINVHFYTHHTVVINAWVVVKYLIVILFLYDDVEKLRFAMIEKKNRYNTFFNGGFRG